MSNSGKSAEISVVYNGKDPKASLISLNMSSITKLSPSNYLTWMLQVRAFLEAHELHVFLEDTDATPASTVTEGDETQPNPLYAIWKRQDKMLYSALLGTLTLSVQSTVARATTSKEIWQTLANVYGKPSRAHVKQLKMQLKNISKADQVALLGSPIEHEDLLDIINGKYQVLNTYSLMITQTRGSFVYQEEMENSKIP